jgi:HSP20 family protein
MLAKENETKGALARWDDDFAPMMPLRREMSRLFDDFFRGWDMPAAFNGAALTPHVDVKESDKEITVTAELPGVAEKDIEVSISGDVLTLKGEKKAEKEEKDGNYHRIERRYGSFHRSFSLPSEVDAAAVAASHKNGVLTVTLPKSKAAREASRKIAVKAG